MVHNKLNVFNLDKVHDMLDGFAKLTGLAVAIVDLQEEVLLHCGWKTICEEYHRVYPETAGKCFASDTAIKQALKAGQPYHMEYCLNGLADAAVPLIIEQEHIANVFVGQFLFEDPDISYFKKQANEYGFDESSYLQALDEIPIITQEFLDHAMGLLRSILHSISEEVLQNSRLSELNTALQTSEEKHRRLFETMTQGVVYQAADGLIISANPAAERILGLSFDQMQGKTSMDPRWKMITEDGTPVPGDEHPAMIALSTGEIVGPVVRGVFHPDKDAYVWLQITAIPLFRPHEDKPFQVYATFDDITERREAEQKLQESEERYRSLIEQAAEAVYLHDVHGRILEANYAATEQTGYSREELVQLSVFDLHPESSQVNPSPDACVELWKNLSIGKSENLEIEQVRKDGKILPVEVRIGKVVFRDNEYILALISNIADRKRAEEKLRFQSMVLDQIQDSVTVTDLAGVITYVNNASTRALGFSRQELIGATTEKLGEDPEQGAAQGEILEETLRCGTWRGVVVNHSIDGQEIYLDCRTQLLHDDQGNPVALVGVSTDITEFKRFEQKLAASEERFQKMLSLIPDMISIHDPDMNIVYSNWNGFAAVDEEKQVLHTKCYRTYRGNDDVCPDCQALTVLQTKKPFRKKSKLPDGTWIDLHVIPILGQDGTVELIVEWIRDITKDVEAQEEIQRFETIANNAVYGQAIADLEGNLVYVNRFFADIHGYAPDELVGCHSSVLLTAKQWEEIESLIPSLMQKGTYEPTETWHVHRDGTEFPMLMSGVILYDAQGNPQHMAAAAVDMRAYHQAQQDYQLLFAAMQNAVALHEIICDSNGVPIDYRFLSVNPAFEIMTGLRAEDVIGQTVRELLPGIEQFWIDTYGKVALTGNPVNFERYGRKFDKYFNVTAFRPSEGQFACIFEDITERKLAEKFTSIWVDLLEYAQQHTLDQLLQRTLEEAELLTKSRISFYHFVEKDQKTIVLHTWSKNTQELFDRFEGKSMLSSLEHAGVWADCVREMQPVIHNDYASLQDKKGLPEGHAPITRELVVPILRGDSVVGIIGVGNKHDEYTNSDTESLSRLADMTWEIIEQKRSDEQLRDMQTQLTQMQKMETVGRLAGGIAHDFNNMLGVILGHTELVMEQVDPNHTDHDSLQEIRKAAERSAELTAQLLAFARKQTVNPKVLDINDEISDMIKMLNRLIREDVDIYWHPDHDIWAVQIDPSQLHQILINLCVNAREAISGTGTITIETQNTVLDQGYCAQHEQLIPGEYVMMSVSDTGCGIDETVLPHVFEPFFTTHEVGKGTGMGLATVYGIVKQNQGCINIYSEVGQGTTINIYLPKHDKKEALPHTPHSRTEAVQGQGTLLVVDDNPSILSMTQKMLERLGYTVYAAETPEEAIHIAQSCDHPVDMLITDVVMPEMSGRELADILQAQYPEMKLLFMSGYTNNAIAHQGVLDEGVSYIQKPFSMKELSETIRDVLES